jgi:hypothetical protein
MALVVAGRLMQQPPPDGRFDDLFMKAIAHHVLASAGRPVPPRAVALAPSTPLADWASPHADTDAEVLAWIAGHARGRPNYRARRLHLACTGHPAPRH